MTSRRYQLVIGLIGLALASPLQAQHATRLGGPEPAKPSNFAKLEQEAQRVMIDYARCVVKRSPKKVNEYLALFPNSDSAKKALALATSDCLAFGELRFKPALFRGGLYEALYHRDYKRSGPADFTSTPPINYSAGSPAGEDSTVEVALRNFADCVARADPLSARQLLLAKVASEDESLIFGKLMPSLSACLTEGVELKFSKPIL